MTTHQDEHIKMLEWAISFAQSNFESFKRDDWDKLRKELYYFAQRSENALSIGVSLSREGDIDFRTLCKRATEATIRRLQLRLKLALLKLACEEVQQKDQAPLPIGPDGFLP